MAFIDINITGWDQEKKNMTKAMVVMILHQNGITHGGVNVSLPSIEVVNPSGGIGCLTAQSITTAYDAWKIESDARTAAAEAEQEARDAELDVNVLVTIKMEQIDAAIDSLSNLAELKAFLKKLCRYIKARGI